MQYKTVPFFSAITSFFSSCSYTQHSERRTFRFFFHTKPATWYMLQSNAHIFFLYSSRTVSFERILLVFFLLCIYSKMYVSRWYIFGYLAIHRSVSVLMLTSKNTNAVPQTQYVKKEKQNMKNRRRRSKPCCLNRCSSPHILRSLEYTNILKPALFFSMSRRIIIDILHIRRKQRWQRQVEMFSSEMDTQRAVYVMKYPFSSVEKSKIQIGCRWEPRYARWVCFFFFFFSLFEFKSRPQGFIISELVLSSFGRSIQWCGQSVAPVAGDYGSIFLPTGSTSHARCDDENPFCPQPMILWFVYPKINRIGSDGLEIKTTKCFIPYGDVRLITNHSSSILCATAAAVAATDRRTTCITRVKKIEWIERGECTAI